MIRMFAQHHVKDYETWREVYDRFDRTRRTLGVRGQSVFRSADDPNDITVEHDFDDLETARRFVDDDRVRDAMSAGGVQGEPEIRFTEPAD